MLAIGLRKCSGSVRPLILFRTLRHLLVVPLVFQEIDF